MMISLVANIINIFATTLQNILQLASFTGKIIVSFVTWISTLIISTLETIFLFFQIVYEDNITLFTEEIPTSANGVFDAIYSQVNQLQDVVSNTCNDIYLKCSSGLTTVSWLIQAVAVMCGEVLIAFKVTVIFVGDTMWFILTFIPVHLPQLIRAAFKYVGNIVMDTVIDGYMSLLQFTNFLTEVPLQSFMGIASAIVIVRLCVHFRDEILTQIILLYWSMLRNILYFYYVLLSYFTNSDVAIIPRIVSGEDVGAREADFTASEADETANAADALCVICQERQKCILTLPCRHVCLCVDCCRRLYGYQRTCPICRTFIYHSVTVYL